MFDYISLTEGFSGAKRPGDFASHPARSRRIQHGNKDYGFCDFALLRAKLQRESNRSNRGMLLG
ncbi:MAG: hypothetical protein CVV42_03970 [Candidatus Riflebacteria bacterium HGW-Riflebacteria-2]|nr:MAG: hypothetical protein CVV42_03970 [Candidatus Riflebacteria bacterium HGW-Riflebacteria-2]